MVLLSQKVQSKKCHWDRKRPLGLDALVEDEQEITNLIFLYFHLSVTHTICSYYWENPILCFLKHLPTDCERGERAEEHPWGVLWVCARDQLHRHTAYLQGSVLHHPGHLDRPHSCYGNMDDRSVLLAAGKILPVSYRSKYCFVNYAAKLKYINNSELL